MPLTPTLSPFALLTGRGSRAVNGDNVSGSLSLLSLRKQGEGWGEGALTIASFNPRGEAPPLHDCGETIRAASAASCGSCALAPARSQFVSMRVIEPPEDKLRSVPILDERGAYQVNTKVLHDQSDRQKPPRDVSLVSLIRELFRRGLRTP